MVLGEKMKFSILVPVYNVERYLEECLNSLINQTFKDFEIILVDDGSTDRSGQICDQYQKNYSNVNISVLHKKNEGLVSARRAGIKIAQGEYSVFCDSDDFLELDALQKLNKVLMQQDIDIVIYNGYEVVQEGKRTFFENIFEEGIIDCKTKVIDKLLLSYEINSLCLKAVKTNLIDKDKDYKSFYSCNYGEDLLQTVPMILNARKIYYLNNKLYNYRITSGMMKKYNSNYYISYKKVNQEIFELIRKSKLEDCKEKLAIHLLVAAYGAISQFKFLDKVDKIEIEKLSNDKDFRNAYESVLNTKYNKYLNKKQKILLKAIYKKNYGIIKVLINIAKVRNSKRR